MTFSLTRLILAIVVAAAVGIILVALLGPILITLKVPIATTFGDFCKNWGWPIGVLIGVWYYFKGYQTFGPKA